MYITRTTEVRTVPVSTRVLRHTEALEVEKVEEAVIVEAISPDEQKREKESGAEPERQPKSREPEHEADSHPTIDLQV
jgi:hypothetical protein